MGKTNKAFILISFLIVIFAFFTNKSFSQESNCLNDFKSWILKNEDNSEKIVYTLPCDMVIDDYFELSIPYGTKITIDTNKYKILIKDKGNFFINGNELNIVGEGETEGVIHVEQGGKLSIGIDNITALNGTALYAEEEADLIISTYYGEIGNIKASGENAIGIYSENDIRVDCKTIEVDGENAIGIYSKGEVEIEDTSVTVNGDNKQQGVGLESNNKEGKSIVSETKNVYIIGEQNTIMPDIPLDEDYNIIRCNRRGIDVFEEEIMITKEDKIEDLKLPQIVTLKTSSGKFVNLEVDWDLSNYYTDLDRETEFIIKGKFKEEHLNEKNIVLNDNVAPILYVHVTNKEPINDLEVFFLNSKKGYSAVLKYSIPYNAKKIFVEYSDDGINWVSKELDYISNQAEFYFEDFKLRCFRVKVEGGLREGYSNIFLKPGFVMGGGNDQMTPEDDRDVIIDGGDRGGGGRDDPDRDDSSSENEENGNKEENNDKNKENNNSSSNENNDSDGGKPNAPEDSIGPSTGGIENKNHQDNKEDSSTNSDKEDGYEYENKFNSKNLISENDSNYNLKQKSVFSNNNQYFSYRDVFVNKNQEINNRKLGVSNYNKVSNYNENFKSVSKGYTLNREFFFLLCILTPTMVGSILVVNPSVRKKVIEFIQIKK